MVASRANIVCYKMFSRLVSDLLVLCTDVPDLCSTDSIYLMRSVTKVAVEVGSLMRYPPPYPVEEYISRYTPRLDACRLAMMPFDPSLTI